MCNVQQFAANILILSARTGHCWMPTAAHERCLIILVHESYTEFCSYPRSRSIASHAMHCRSLKAKSTLAHVQHTLRHLQMGSVMLPCVAYPCPSLILIFP